MSTQLEQLNELTAELLKLRSLYEAELADIDAKVANCRRLGERFQQQVASVERIVASVTEKLRRDPADAWKGDDEP